MLVLYLELAEFLISPVMPWIAILKCLVKCFSLKISDEKNKKFIPKLLLVKCQIEPMRNL